jgi:Fe-S-cluster-containing dehydrogenase component
MVRYGMVIDLKKCIGCDSCTIACRAENFTPPRVFWNRVFKFEVGKYPNARLVSLPLMCMHCKSAPCVEACPTGATYRRNDGIVLVDYDKCVGCRYCVVVCPYGERFFNSDLSRYYPNKPSTPYEQLSERLDDPKHHVIGVVEKCTFCADRVDRGQDPACVRSCVANARIFGDLDDPTSSVSRLVATSHAVQLSPELGTDPSVYYIPP